MSVFSSLTGRTKLLAALPVLWVLWAIPTVVQAQGVVLQRPKAAHSAPSSTVNATGTVRVYALMVEFQPDDNRFTTGDGTFNPDYLANPDIPITIDPLPHDAGYFGAHLSFMAEYFNRVSGGLLTIEWRLHPEVIRLNQTMDAYSPLGEDGAQDYKLVDLARDSWQAAAAGGQLDLSGFDENRDAFIIFHAGAGRDINFLGTSLDRTPQDIPSLYLNLDTFRRFGNDPAFQGFAVATSDGGTFRIKNSLILPETESRPGVDVTDEPFVLQLGINGLLCATVANHLGLPDLYNTIDGSAAIGRFGLMDGAGFFSYFGMFPPEPSAWEKYHLGWITPVEIDARQNGIFQLPAVALRQPNSVYKIRISDDEYFLVENRHRDPAGDGLKVTVRGPDGSTQQRTLPVFDDLFGSTSADSLQKLLPPGVVVSVDDYDWSLPGGVDVGGDETLGTADDRTLNGGILIWHIDEAVLRAGNYRAGVNDNPRRRGVDVVEADGSQDIGFQTTNQFLGGFVNGTAFDFWWSGNNARVITQTGREIQLYQNRFGPDTRPANKSNTGAVNYFELYDFSDNVVTASFSIRPVIPTDLEPIALDVRLPEGIRNNAGVNAFPLAPLVHFPPGQAGDSLLIIPHAGAIEAVSLNLAKRGQVQTIDRKGTYQPWAFQNHLFLAQDPRFGHPKEGVAAYEYTTSGYVADWVQDNVPPSTAFLSQTEANILDLDGTSTRLDRSSGGVRDPYAEAMQRTERMGGRRFRLTGARLEAEDGPLSMAVAAPANPQWRQYAAVIQAGQETPGAAVLIEANRMSILSDGFPTGRVIFPEGSWGWPALVDLDENGQTEILAVNRATGAIEARNQTGAMVNGFPLRPPPGMRFVGTPLSVDFENQGRNSLVVAAVDSLSMVLLAYDADLRPRDGFPLLVGGLMSSDDEPYSPLYAARHLYAVSPTGELKAWRIRDGGPSPWPGTYGEFANGKVTGFTTATDAEPGRGGLLVMDETYNWPNPADFETNLRFMTNRPATVDIQIISPDGASVFRHTATTPGKMAQEVVIPTSRLGNGVYLARLKARDENGDEESKIVKIAVIH